MNGAGLVTIADNLGAYNRVFDASAATAAAPATALVLASTPTSGAAGSTVTATATLTSNGQPVAGKTVTFSIGMDQATEATDSNGVASADVLLTGVPGTYALSAGFPGDSTLRSSGASHPFTIGKVDTTLTLTGPSSPIAIGTNSPIVATLTSGATPVKFRTVWFVVTGTNPAVIPVLTDTTGKATIATDTMLGGTYSVTACFDKPTPQGVCPVTAALDRHVHRVRVDPPSPCV